MLPYDLRKQNRRFFVWEAQMMGTHSVAFNSLTGVAALWKANVQMDLKTCCHGLLQVQQVETDTWR